MGWEWRVFMPLNQDEQRVFSSNDQGKIERREDIYYLANDKVGIKQRDGEGNFEVKVLQGSMKRGSEQYKKYIVPRSEVPDYYPEFDETKSITVIKERHKAHVGEVKSEICYAFAKGKWWKSMQWEGKPELVYCEVQKQFNLKDVWKLSDIQLPDGSVIGGYPHWVSVISGSSQPRVMKAPIKSKLTRMMAIPPGWNCPYKNLTSWT